MSSADGLSDPSAPKKPSLNGALLVAQLLRATLASMRCRNLVDDGRHDEALLELALLDDALDQVHDIGCSGDRRRDFEQLDAQRARLRRLLQPASNDRRAQDVNDE
ncbi:MAG: hypothetical protein HOW73_26840 [Polyangiaceae bacterium]|nr:hypothetical protein [Polyangiaceae bacterium]